MDFDGDTDRNDWFYLRAAFIDAGQGAQLAGFAVPEPTVNFGTLLILFAFCIRNRKTRIHHSKKA